MISEKNLYICRLKNNSEKWRPETIIKTGRNRKAL